ncbi:class I SAM-dependent methyltransferase [Delftia sp.]|uniref:SAM-dependent methyltransferase n=1 Tax=Delftia sp. TaxID=1886637 RepID=UPI00259CDCEE|nr:class I SAM-dependent methyltransferase [Delftia sp.]
MNGARQHFERMYQADPDPWQVASRWYERRKRDLLLAALPRERYAHGFEPGCGNGEATQRLLQRCDRLCAVDFSDRAVDLCRQRIAPQDRARLDLQALPLPWQWPQVPQVPSKASISSWSRSLPTTSTTRPWRISTASAWPRCRAAATGSCATGGMGRTITCRAPAPCMTACRPMRSCTCC